MTSSDIGAYKRGCRVSIGGYVRRAHVTKDGKTGVQGGGLGKCIEHCVAQVEGWLCLREKSMTYVKTRGDIVGGKSEKRGADMVVQWYGLCT